MPRGLSSPPATTCSPCELAAGAHATAMPDSRRHHGDHGLTHEPAATAAHGLLPAGRRRPDVNPFLVGGGIRGARLARQRTRIVRVCVGSSADSSSSVYRPRRRGRRLAIAMRRAMSSTVRAPVVPSTRAPRLRRSRTATGASQVRMNESQLELLGDQLEVAQVVCRKRHVVHDATCRDPQIVRAPLLQTAAQLRVHRCPIARRFGRRLARACTARCIRQVPRCGLGPLRTSR